MDRPSPERGAASLVEILLAIAIVGIGFAGILGGLSSVILGSHLHQDRSEAQLVLTSAADALRDPAVPHVPCAEAAEVDYVTAVESAIPPDWAASIEITGVEYWDGTSFNAGAANCHDTDDLGHLLTLQLVSIEVTSPDSRTSESVAVVKAP